MGALPPIIGERPRTLVLGSMPSETSLAEQQYYAHPRNAFWWIMGTIFGFDESLHYPQRVAALRGHPVAVWDVLSNCERPGSLDSNIVKASEQANDFGAFFEQFPGIRTIAFNGATAESIFKRRCLMQYTNPQFVFQRLPSTSPAHASMTREQKLEVWRSALVR